MGIRNLVRLPRNNGPLQSNSSSKSPRNSNNMSSRSSFSLFPSPILQRLALLAFFSLAAVFFFQKVNRVISHTKTVAGHNLKPTPWHLFLPKEFENDSSTYTTIFHCSYVTCRISSSSTALNILKRQHEYPFQSSSSSSSCPSVFKWIYKDLAPWAKSRISISNLMEAQKHAAFRIVISGGRLYVDLYYDCVQSRAMFTIWGLLQLLRRYPGMIPDVDLMFDCMDKPVIGMFEYSGDKKPPPLFRYCTTKQHFDIPFPDWSFWSWPEVNIGPWDEEFRSIKLGSQSVNWTMKHDTAYWKGNPDVQSPVRVELLKCNDTRTWGAQIMRQNWIEEAKAGFQQSKLANQCNHRYKIYAEGYAWSVSLKYIMSCGSVALIIDPVYEDFFSRGLIPKKSYWPVSPVNLCESIKHAVDWGKEHPLKAEAIGRRGQEYMQDMNMRRIYDYMYHILVEYSKLLDFKPAPPSSAQEVCAESILCLASPEQKQFLERSSTSPSSSRPCTLRTAKNKKKKNQKMTR